MSVRRIFLGGVLTVVLVALGVSRTLSKERSSEQECLLTVLHTNDTHGHLLPFSYPELFDPGSPLAYLPTRRAIGGIARRASLARQVRQEQGRSVVLVDAGDVCDGTPFSTEYHGEADIAAMNAAGYDAACPGNHEFNNTVAQVRKLISMAKFPLVCANVVDRTTKTSPFRPYIVRRVGSLRVALFGLLTPEAQTYPAGRESLEVLPPAEVASRLVPLLRREADLVVLLSHLGIQEDRRLAAEVEGIDVIVGGHSHTYLRAPLFIGRVPGPSKDSVNGTVITQAFEWGAGLGRLDMRLRRTGTRRWSLARYYGRLLPVDRSIAEDRTTAAVVQRYWQPIATTYGRRVGTAVADFAQKGYDHAEYNLVADAIREATGQDVALENAGGVRAPLVRGPITYWDLVTMDPFNNTLVTMKLTGQQLRAILAQRRPAVSGLRYVLDRGQLVKATVGSQPLREDATYRVVTNSYFARDPLFQGVTERTELPTKRLDAIIRYIQKRGSVAPSYDGRRVVRNMRDEF